MQEIHSCSFTGHRSIKKTHEKEIGALVMRAIEYAYSRGCREYYTGGALGFDTVAARQVLLFKISHPDITLGLLLPCKNQDKNWSESERDAYNYILKHADFSEFFSDSYTDDCMKKRNTALAERADILVAYVFREYSGAGQTVRIAKKLGKEVYNIYPSLEKCGTDQNKTAQKASSEEK